MSLPKLGPFPAGDTQILAHPSFVYFLDRGSGGEFHYTGQNADTDSQPESLNNCKNKIILLSDAELEMEEEADIF